LKTGEEYHKRFKHLQIDKDAQVESLRVSLELGLSFAKSRAIIVSKEMLIIAYQFLIIFLPT